MKFEVGHPVHEVIGAHGADPVKVISDLAQAGYVIVPNSEGATPKEYPKLIEGQDGVARIVNSRQEEEEHKPAPKPAFLMPGKPSASATAKPV